MMLKKSLSLLLALMLIVASVPLSAVGVSAADGDEEPDTSTWYVVGNNADLLGRAWAADEANAMTLGGDGKYTKVYTNVAPTTGRDPMSIKVTNTVDWIGNKYGKNIVVEIDETCDVTVTYDPNLVDATQVTVTGEHVKMHDFSPATVEQMAAVGQGQGGFLDDESWNLNANIMTEEAAGVYTIEYEDVDAAQMQFKFVANGSWTDNFGASDDAVNLGKDNVAVYDSQTNIYFNVNEDGSKVKLTLDMSNFDYESLTGATYKVQVWGPDGKEVVDEEEPTEEPTQAPTEVPATVAPTVEPTEPATEPKMLPVTPTADDAAKYGQQLIYFEYPTDGTWGDASKVTINYFNQTANVYCYVYAIYGNEYEFFDSGWETSASACKAVEGRPNVYAYDLNSTKTVRVLNPETGKKEKKTLYRFMEENPDIDYGIIFSTSNGGGFQTADLNMNSDCIGDTVTLVTPYQTRENAANSVKNDYLSKWENHPNFETMAIISPIGTFFPGQFPAHAPRAKMLADKLKDYLTNPVNVGYFNKVANNKALCDSIESTPLDVYNWYKTANADALQATPEPADADTPVEFVRYMGKNANGEDEEKKMATLKVVQEVLGLSDEDVADEDEPTQAPTTEPEKQLVRLNITQLPDKTSYVYGEALNLSGMQVMAVYSDYSVETVTDYAVTPLQNAIGEQTITLTYEGMTASFNVTVGKGELTGLTLENAPNKRRYQVGEALDLSGMILVATYDSGYTEYVTDCDAEANLNEEGYTVPVTLSYGGKSVSYNVRVTAPVLMGINISKTPDKIQYLPGEAFDPTGMTVTAFYNDGSERQVTDYTVSPMDAQGGVQQLTVSWQDKTAPLTVVVYALGDVNKDGVITVADVTLLQKSLVELATLDESERQLADFNQDGEISIADATMIQMHISQ